MQNTQHQIVLLDDNHEYLQVMELLLQDTFQVIAFSEVDKCEDWLKKGQNISALLIDYHLKKQTGSEVYRSVRRQGYKGPVIFLSADGDPEKIAECLELGIDEYLEKSVPYEVLSDHIISQIFHYKYLNPYPGV